MVVPLDLLLAGLEYIVEDERLLPYDDLTDEEPVDVPNEDEPLDLTVLPADDLTADDLPEDDLTEDDLTDEEVDLATEEIDDLVPPVRPLILDDLVDDADIEDLVDPEIPLDLAIDELLTPALLDADPMPPLLLEPVVDRRGV